MAIYNQSMQSPSLYVGDLAEDVTEQTLHEIFSNIGAVASIRVCRDHITRQSLGYAYVNFHNAIDADRAIQTLNFQLIHDRQCRIMWSQRDPSLRKSGVGNIFVKNIDVKMDNKTLMDNFSLFGNILSCKISTDIEGNSKGYGYVHFDSIEAAQKAISHFEKEGTFQVSFFQRREDRLKTLKWTNVYIKNIPQEWNESELQKVFSKFGECGSIKISKDLDSTPDSPHRGFGFVDFKNHESAMQAVEYYKNNPFEISSNVFLYVERFKSRFERQREKDKNFAAKKYERMQRYTGVNLYVKNLEDSIDENALRDLFSKFGTVISTRVMRDLNGYSRGFGFVSFSTSEEARRAITEINNTIVWGKPIKVYLALSKEQRRVQTQASQQLFSRGGPYPQSVFGVPMYMSPNQPVPNPSRSFQIMPVMRQPRSQIPYRTYPIPSYAAMNQFSSPPYPNGAPQQQQSQQPPQPQQLIQNRRPRPSNKPTSPHQRNNRQNQISSNRSIDNQQQSQQQQQQQTSQPQQSQSQPQPQSQPQQPISVNERLTSQMLASVDEARQKYLIGERLFPKIEKINSTFAAKITGMLLEMENTELLHLLETQTALNQKVEEALTVLREYQRQTQP